MPAKTVKAPVRARRSKAEVQQEFAEVQEQVEQARESPDTKGLEAARLRESEIRQAADGATVEGVVQRISALGLEGSPALSDVRSEERRVGRESRSRWRPRAAKRAA